MSFFMTIMIFIIGLILIIKSGDIFVNAAIMLAEITHIPKILIGATVVSLATTLPELLVSVMSVAQGSIDLGISNNIGSVICNTGFIMGLSILCIPQTLSGNSFRNKGLLLLGFTGLLFYLCRDLNISYSDSLLLMGCFLIFTGLSVLEAKAGQNEETTMPSPEATDTNISKEKCFLGFFLGAAGIIIGARLLVNSGITIAAFLGIPERIIGLTIVALGTSLPELVTAVTALLKQEGQMSVGNILGANIMNITLIPACCGMIAAGHMTLNLQQTPFFTEPISSTLYIDIPLSMVLMSLIILPSLITKKIKRYQGLGVLLLYLAYICLIGTH
ncbi:MAG: calcium/sodium antiporter [Peptococcaceae bacterium]|nr:calcium/sodium antiporter [Peptococcaceae bacterium]